MGTFRQAIEIGDSEGRRFERVEALVDTDATYTSIPRDILARLEVSAQEQRPFILANGQQVSYGVAWLRLRLDGREEPTLVIFADEGSQPLLGAFALDGFGLAVDPQNRRLVPTPGFLVALHHNDL